MAAALLALGAALTGALVNQLFTAWRESRSDRRDQGRALERRQHDEMVERLDRLEQLVMDLRERQAGIAALVNGLVVAPLDKRPRRGS